MYKSYLSLTITTPERGEVYGYGNNVRSSPAIPELITITVE